jgi:hypothetical protein
VFIHPQYLHRDAVESARAHIGKGSCKYGLVPFAALTKHGAWWRLEGEEWEYEIESPDEVTLTQILNAGIRDRLRVRIRIPGTVRAEAPFHGPDLVRVYEDWLAQRDPPSPCIIVRWTPDEASSRPMLDSPMLMIRANVDQQRLQLQVWEYAAPGWTSVRYGHLLVSEAGAVVHADVGDIEYEHEQERLCRELANGWVEKGNKKKLWRIDPIESDQVRVDTALRWFSRAFRSTGEVLVDEVLSVQGAHGALEAFGLRPTSA